MSTNAKQALSVFQSAEGMVRPFVKLALDGFQGSGKSVTAAKCALGIYKKWGLRGPVYVYDNEKSAKFLIPMFGKEGIKVSVVESESLDVLGKAIDEVEAQQGLLLIDSVTKIHSRLCRDYLANLPVRRKSIEMQDRPIINEAWQTGFADKFVNAEAHIIFTGRANIEWANEEIEDDRTGKTKRTFYAKGVKLAGHKETLYEPDYVIYMERQEVLLSGPKKGGKKSDKEVWREATVIKDRSQLLDGKTFRNPEYNDVAPMFEFLLTLPEARPNMVEGNPENIFGTDENMRAFFKRRDVALEELDGLLTRALPGQKSEEKQARVQCLVDVYGTASKTKIEGMRPELIEGGLPRVKEWLTRLYNERNVGSPLDPTPDPEFQLRQITLLSTQLLERGKNGDDLVAFYEAGAGVRDVKHIQPADYSRVIVKLEAELAALPPLGEGKPKRNGNGKKTANALAVTLQAPADRPADSSEMFE